MGMIAPKLPIVVLISGLGSNLQAIIDATHHGLPVEIRAVISNRSDAYGLERAQQNGIPSYALAHSRFPDRQAFEAELRKLIDQYQPQLVVLAGFMRKLTPDFVKQYPGRIINIHPSLLPKYPGLHTHRQVLENRDALHGVTIHYVTEEIDAGPIIIQKSLPVGPNDTEETLRQRIHVLEHQLYPEVLAWFAEGKIKLPQL